MNVRRHRVSLLIGALVCCTGSALAQPSTGSGACCTRDSAGAITCTVSTLQACFAAHGLWRGPNTTCGANSCPTPPPPPTGACCTRDAAGAASCAVSTLADCAAAQGLWRGPNTTCGANSCPTPPPPPTGACCTRDAAGAASCAVSTLADCAAAQGLWRGPNTTCGANSCPTPPPPPTGACCVTDANGASTCSVTSRDDCATAQGHWFGPNSACTSDGGCPTPPARGACCITDHRQNHTLCGVGTAEQCAAAHGTYQGDGVACSPTACPRPIIGACCVAATATAGAHCSITAEAACTAGVWGGANSTCRSVDCPAACACDWDHSGRVDGADFFAFFNDWHAGNADFNNDGVTDQQDLIDFAACVRNPPADCTGGSGGGGLHIAPVSSTTTPVHAATGANPG